MKNADGNEIANAFRGLDLPIGTSFEDAMQQYKWLAYNFHTDRTNNPAFIKRNEQKMKEINAAKGVLEAHFRGPDAPHSHGPGCPCQPGASTKSAPEQNLAEESSNGASSRTAQRSADISEAEALAKQRTAARARARGRKPKVEVPEAPMPPKEVEPDPEAIARLEREWRVQDKRAQEMLRWKIAGVCFAIMGVLYLVSYIGLSIRG